MDDPQARAERRLRCDAYQAALNADPEDAVLLLRVLDARREGFVSLESAQTVISALRAKQQP